MRALSAGELLEVWERGLARSPAQRALLLLASALRETPVEELGQLSIGRRDAHLLSLREEIFGSRFSSLTSCPACGGQLEFELEASQLRVAPPPPTEDLQIKLAEHTIEFRLPTSLDVASLDPAAELEANRRELLQSCVRLARKGATEIAVTEFAEGEH
jgi:hypothetical protein